MDRRIRLQYLLICCVAALLIACQGEAQPPTTESTETGAEASAPTANPTPPPPTVPPIDTPTPTNTPLPTPTATAAITVTATTTPTPTRTPTPRPTIEGTFARGAATQRPVVVMIDNHPNAYPQAGMNNAALVFEALAEYGITRYMPVYVPGITPDTDTIGPVRSTRTYFVRWAMGFNAVYVHAGGSPGGLQLAESASEIVNMDALRVDAESYFYRSEEKVAPHNLYTSSELVQQFVNDHDTQPVDLSEMGYYYKPDKPADERPAGQRIDYYFIYADDPAGWLYDHGSNGYLRTRRNEPHRDGVTGQQLWFKNIIVMEVQEAPIPGDTKGRIEQQVVGKGRARLFLDGVEREMVWRKPDVASPLRFYTTSGEEIELNAGPTWVAVLPDIANLTVQSR